MKSFERIRVNLEAQRHHNVISKQIDLTVKTKLFCRFYTLSRIDTEQKQPINQIYRKIIITKLNKIYIICINIFVYHKNLITPQTN